MNPHTAKPERLYLMKVAALPPPSNTPAVCYLIQTGDGTNILIDSGMPDRETLPPSMSEVVMGLTVVEQLAQLSLRPADIDLLICTHFDLDHSGQHAAFSSSEFIVQRSHFEAARLDDRFARTRSQWDQAETRFRFVDGDTQLFPGLELIETSGHVPGHQSVLVHLPETGAGLLTIDAVPDRESFTFDRDPSHRDLDAEGTRAGTRKLIELAEREHVRLTIFGHDGSQWESLKKLPEYYG